MNALDKNVLLNFAEMTLQYLTEAQEYSVTGLWSAKNMANKLYDKLLKYAPLVSGIIESESNT